MTLFFVLLGIAVLGGVAVVAAGQGDGLESAPVDRAPLELPEGRLLARPDIDGLTFSVGLRGYRMDEVDDVLDRLAVDIAQRDQELEVLRSQVGSTVQELTDQLPTASGAAFVVPEQPVPDQPTERTMIVPLDPLDVRGD